MVDARSKLDILYQDVLGEIHEVIDRVDGLKANIPAVADNATKKLELQTGMMLAAAEKLRDSIDTLKGQTNTCINAAKYKAVEAASVDIRQAAQQAATASVKEAVGAEVQKVVCSVNEAAANLVKETDRMQANLKAASRQVVWGWGKHLTAMTCASLLGSLLMFLILYLSNAFQPRSSMPELSATDRQAIQDGRALKQAWNSLTKKEREHISELTKIVQ